MFRAFAIAIRASDLPVGLPGRLCHD